MTLMKFQKSTGRSGVAIVVCVAMRMSVSHSTPASANDTLGALVAALARMQDERQEQVVDVGEQVIESAAGVSSERAPGLGQAFQRRIEVQADRLRAMLDAASPDYDAIKEAGKELAEAIRVFRQVPIFPAAQPVERSGTSVNILVSGADWQEGLLADTVADADGLALPDDRALALQGNRAYVDTGIVMNELPGERLTFSFWIHPTQSQSGAILEGNFTGANERWELVYQSTGLVSLRNHGRPSRATTSGSGSVPAHQWTHVAVTFDAEQTLTEYYINGNRMVEITDQAPYSLRGHDEKPLRIGGKEREPNQHFMIRDLRIWDSVRTRDQIRKDMYVALAGDEPGLVASWPMDEGEGDRIADQSPHAYHGQVYDGRWQPRITQGHRVSQPILLTSINRIDQSSIRWEATTPKDDADGITVLVGLSDSAESLPETWHKAANGEPIPGLGAGENVQGKAIWTQQVLTRRGVESPRLHRLHLEITGN